MIWRVDRTGVSVDMVVCLDLIFGICLLHVF
jgi:hypothetical protein